MKLMTLKQKKNRRTSTLIADNILDTFSHVPLFYNFKFVKIWSVKNA